MKIDRDSAIVQGDQIQLHTLAHNLIDNAVKFTRGGGRVKVGLHSQGDEVVISVEDTGIGIPEEDLPLMFSRFHRGNNASAYPGSGLGLAIVEAIADIHQATITLNNDSKGTQVGVRFAVQQKI